METTQLTEVFEYNKMYFDLEKIRSRSRRQDVVMMRKLACTVLRKAGHSYHAIGAFVNRSHCSVMHLVNNCTWAYGYNIEFPSMKPEDIQKQIEFHQKKINELRRKLTALTSPSP